jgi:hypothetical protein
MDFGSRLLAFQTLVLPRPTPVGRGFFLLPHAPVEALENQNRVSDGPRLQCNDLGIVLGQFLPASSRKARQLTVTGVAVEKGIKAVISANFSRCAGRRFDTLTDQLEPGRKSFSTPTGFIASHHAY